MNNNNDSDLKTIIEKRADARFSDERIVERRKQPRQTRAMFIAHVEEYCAKKEKK